jgi:hypothetical protein
MKHWLCPPSTTISQLPFKRNRAHQDPKQSRILSTENIMLQIVEFRNQGKHTHFLLELRSVPLHDAPSCSFSLGTSNAGIILQTKTQTPDQYCCHQISQIT